MIARYDLYRMAGKTDIVTFVRYFFLDKVFRKIYYFRKIQAGGVFKSFFLLLNAINARKTTIDLPLSVQLGDGVLFLHPYAIAINSKSVIGKNFTILKGATIGNTKSGKHPGTPVIGDNVYLGLNSTIVGGVKIGNNVMICANTFVNFDVPDDSLVIGCPGVVHAKSAASKEYINNSIEGVL